MAEVQQSSDATFRLYDWNRLGTDGKPRALHLEESLRAIDFDRGPVNPVPDQEPLVRCPYFELQRKRLEDGPWEVPQGELSIGMVLQGAAQLSRYNYQRAFPCGSTVLIPASAPSLAWTRTPSQDTCIVLQITLPSLPH